MYDAAAAIHENDIFVAGKADIIKSAQQRTKEDIRSGVREDLPTKFLGLNYRRGQQGELIVDCQHYVGSMKIPDLKQLAGKAKHDVLSQELQSTFRNMTSKVNALAHTVRPDIMYAAKSLSTKNGMATKSDMDVTVGLKASSKVLVWAISIMLLSVGYSRGVDRPP